MRVKEILVPLREAIQAPLYQQGYQAIQAGIKPWMTTIMPIIDEYTNKAQHNDQLKNYSPEDYEEVAKLRDNQYDREYDVLVRQENPELRQQLVETFKTMLEEQLRTAALNHMETLFGKIERYDYADSPPYEEIRKLNLYFLQYLIVDLDYKGTYELSGKPKRGGGVFTDFPDPSQQWSDQYSQKTVDWKHRNMLGAAIKIYVTEERLWLAAIDRILHYLHIDHYGESQSDNEGFDELLANILPTWVHEVVHLEQMARRVIQGITSHKASAGMSYTPMDKPRPKFTKYDQETSKPTTVRGGRRGFPSHLGNQEGIEMPEWIEYFGTSHEIEAHAAGAAADVMHAIMLDSQRHAYSDNYKQELINREIDTNIQGIARGYYPESHSLESYQGYIRDQGYKLLRLRKWKDERTLNKINIGARRAWTLFLSKLVKHLQSYKKPVSNYSDRDPRLRTPEISKPLLPDSP